LAELIRAAAAGHFPDVDGGWHRVPPWRPRLQAIVAFTGHAVLALTDDVLDRTLIDLGVDGFGGAHDPRLISTLAGPNGWIDSLDAIMVGRGHGDGRASLVPRPDLTDHPRAQHAASIRSGPKVFGYPEPTSHSVVIVSQGLGGLSELSFELDAQERGTGRGQALVRDALDLVPAGELVLASVAPGNAASLRSLLHAGFTPVGSVQLFRSQK
jgi:hypothetical protein